MTGRFSEAIRPNFGWPSAQPFEHLALLCRAWKNVTSWILKLSRPLFIVALMTCLMISFSSRSTYLTTSGLGLHGLIGRLSFCSVLEERPFQKARVMDLSCNLFLNGRMWCAVLPLLPLFVVVAVVVVNVVSNFYSGHNRLFSVGSQLASRPRRLSSKQTSTPCQT